MDDFDDDNNSVQYKDIDSSIKDQGIYFVDESIGNDDFPVESRKKYNESKKKYAYSDSFPRGKLGEDQWKGFELILKGENVHICGAAGSGKSLLITYCVKALRSLKLRVAVTATTGVAANNLNSSSNEPDMSATTLHWWMGTGLCEESAQVEADKLKAMKAENRWKETDVLFIDEISMLGPELFEKIEKIARIIRKNPAPFGGIQVVLCGDWFQLEPVRDEYKIDDKYKEMNYCFETDAWARTIKDSNVILLTKNYRQETDPEFQKLLDAIREGVLTQETIQLLKNRINAELDLPPNIKPTFLMPLVKQVNKENIKALEEIEGESIKFTWTRADHNMSEDAADRLFRKMSKNLPVDPVIELKIGVPVILLVNLCVEEGFVNGMQGCVESWNEDDGFPIVRFVNGKELKVQQYMWAQKSGRSANGVAFTGITLKQIPLKVAAALTIHKSQSISLDFVKLNLGSNTFAGGQAYTGLSRCRTLKGLSLTDFHISSIRVNPKVIAFYKRYSALKYRLIEDPNAEENEEIKRMVIKLLQEHIPSALDTKTNTFKKRRGYNQAHQTKKPRQNYSSPKDVQDEDCPF